MKVNPFAAMKLIMSTINKQKAPRRQKRYSQMVTSSDAEIQAHNDEVCTRQVLRRLGRPWKMKRALA